MTPDDWADLTPSQQRKQFYRELKAWREEQASLGRPIKPGWVAMKYKARFGRCPPDGAERLTAAESVSEHVRDWIRSQQIAYAKEKRRRAGLRALKTTTVQQSAGTASGDTGEPAGPAR
jgi:hypothetical protein